MKVKEAAGWRSQFILTARTFGYRSTPLQQTITTLEVKPFNLQQIQQFIHDGCLQTGVMSRAGEDDIGVQYERTF
ncbi:MAG: hypothetical protein HC930_09085 [Hydrococcus sp. SU_1_0]|nr:hypothetical protein [Hydrococcus sp. SU_1_0]